MAFYYASCDHFLVRPRLRPRQMASNFLKRWVCTPCLRRPCRPSQQSQMAAWKSTTGFGPAAALINIVSSERSKIAVEVSRVVAKYVRAVSRLHAASLSKFYISFPLFVEQQQSRRTDLLFNHRAHCVIVVFLRGCRSFDAASVIRGSRERCTA